MICEGLFCIEDHLTKLTQKITFQWLDNCERSVQNLKKLLTLTLVLTLPQEGVGFIMFCDAFRVGLGGALVKKNKVKTYASRHLKVHEKSQPTHDLELVVVVFKLWRHYEILSNHHSLPYLFAQQDLNMIQC